MEKFELTDFSGGLNEAFAVSEFKPGQWSRIKGFVIESAKRIRSQWRIREVSASPTYTPSGYAGLPGSGVQQIYPLAGQFGDYILVLMLSGNLFTGSLSYVVRYYKVTDLYGSNPGKVWPLADGLRDNMYEYASRADGDYAWKNDHLTARNQNPDADFSPQLLTPSGVNITIPYRDLQVDGDLVFGFDPRFICTLPYYGGDTGTRKNAVLLNVGHSVDGVPQLSHTTSYVIYEENTGVLHAVSYSSIYPGATADTDANNDGVLDNGGAMTVTSGVMPRANVGVWWRGQLILGDVEYFQDPVSLERAYNEAYMTYVAAKKDHLAAVQEYKNANGQSASYPITAPAAPASIQLNRGIGYVNAYKTWIDSWRATFRANKATSSTTGFTSAPDPNNYASVGVKRYRNGIWFSQPGTFDEFHPFAFTGDICPSDGQIVGFMPVQDGLLVITTSEGSEAVVLLRGTSFGYMADDAAVINVRVETVKSAIGSKPILRTETPPRVTYWPQMGAAVYIGKDSAVYATNGEDVVKLDNFRETEPQEDRFSDPGITSFPREVL